MSHLKSKWVSLPVEFFLIALVGCLLLFYMAWHNRALALTLASLMIAGLVYLQHHFTGKRIDGIKRAEQEKCQHAQAMSDLYLRTIESLAIAIDAKDQTSHGHVRRTQTYATELGRLLDVSHDEHEALMAGALLHDIGKLAVPEYILNKPGDLTLAESAKMRIHPTVGGDILSNVNFPYPVEDIVRYHHEKWDGTGYPAGLKSESIPLVARIISVVDFYDSTRCNRPYRAGMKRVESLALLTNMAGSAFDPTVVAMFVAHVDEFDRLICPQDLREQIPTDEPIETEDVSNDGGQATSASAVLDQNAGFRSITEAQQEVFALHEIAQTIGSSLSLQDNVALVSNKLSAIVPFDTCVIYLVDDKSEHALPVYVLGDHSEAFHKRHIRIGDGITGWVIASGRTISSSTAELDMLGVPEEIAREIKHVLVAPLTREDGAFGAITLYSKTQSPFTSEHVRLTEAVSQSASSALNNALTFEKTKESALIDQLTELPNTRAFYMTLEQRMAECQRLKNREPITVMSMNLDDFKEVNYTYGHATGDGLLCSVAAVIKNQLRQMDMLARYEGDEFIAIVPMASHKTAFLIADRIQTAINEHKFITPDGRAAEISVSIGIASHPEDGETAVRLLAIARRNMQHDKHARKLAPSVIGSSVTSLEPFQI